MWAGLHHLYNGSSGTFLPVKEGNEAMATVTFDNATRQYPGNPIPSVDKLNIEIADGEFLVLVGPSGCGKSTSLRMLAGLEEVNGGRILIGDRDVTNLSPKDRDVAMVFQNYALYPHMTVADNMGFALKIAGVDKGEIRKRVEEAAKILDLTPYLDRKPKALSGGQRQRVAMGRAIVRSPQVFLMDEPLSNLDAKLRVQTRTQIASLQRRLGVTTVYVTHDQVEAMTMGDRVAVLKDGLLQQCDTPLNLYDSPRNLFVAGFIGSPAMNLMEGDVAEDGIHIGDYVVGVPRDVLAKAPNEKRLVLGIRPENFSLAEGNEGIGIDVAVVEELGADAFVYGTVAGLADEDKLTAQQITARISSRNPPERGSTIRLKIDPEHVHVFSQADGRRLSESYAR
jgi:multiple sugar transport system ATP-binding protein